MTGRVSSRSKTEWAVLDELRRHLYDTRDRGSKPTDPGWHVCSCGWEGYWCDWQPHVAEKITKALRPTLAALTEGADERRAASPGVPDDLDALRRRREPHCEWDIYTPCGHDIGED